MELVFYLLLLIGHLGVFDIVYFHNYKCKLHKQEFARSEVIIHTIRHLVYALQFFYVANFRAFGAAIWLVVFLIVIDTVIAFWDTWIEDGARKSLGKLPKGEYFMHILLSLLVGGYLTLLIQVLIKDVKENTAFLYLPPNVPKYLIYYMTLMGVLAVVMFIFDSIKLLKKDEKQ